MQQRATNTIPMPRLARTQLRELKQDLQRERARLENLIGDETTAGDRTRAAATSLGEGPGGLTALLHGRTAERYQAVVYALDRMETGGYGACVVCQQPIPYGRLIAMPEAVTCMACSARA